MTLFETTAPSALAVSMADTIVLIRDARKARAGNEADPRALDVVSTAVGLSHTFTAIHAAFHRFTIAHALDPVIVAPLLEHVVSELGLAHAGHALLEADLLDALEAAGADVDQFVRELAEGV